MTEGFHASASDELHVHLGSIDKSLLYPEEWDSDNRINKNTNEGKAGNQSITFDNENITIYPNPTNGIFTISFENSPLKKGVRGILITDITGKIVYSENKNTGNKIQIDISKENKGIYILKIQTNKKIISSKILKQ